MNESILLQPFFPGVVLGALAFVGGMVIGILGPQRKGRAISYSFFYAMAVLTIAMLVAAPVLFTRGNVTSAYAYGGCGAASLVSLWGVRVALKALYGRK